jgi:esterase/lipase superfamily enzyme
LKLSEYDPNERSVLIFIHGYNVKFSDAAIRAAQIGFDLKVPGVMALYSWPSKANVAAYLADRELIAASETYIIEFISSISKAAGSGARVNIIAHSMGNLGLIRALAAGLSDRRLRNIKFGQIFLAAPDIDVRLFRQLAYVYPHCSERTTLYISATDKPLSVSQWIHENQRTGYSPPVTIVEGIDTVEATNIDVGLLGHGYYAAAAPVLYDMATLVRHNLAPEKRIGLYSEASSDGRYWVMRRQLT